MSPSELYQAVITDADAVTLDFEPFKTIECPYEVRPSAFLSIAEEAAARGGLSGRIDCLSNSKRAIDCQIDTVLAGCGLRSTAARSKFPHKLQLLSTIGLVAPGIVGRLTQYRNLMEHEYIAPNVEKVNDFFDVASLFVNFCSAKLQLLNHVLYLQQAEDPVDKTKKGQCLEIDYSETEDAKVNITAYDVHTKVVGGVIIEPKQKELYLTLLFGMFADARNIDDKDSELLFRRISSALVP